MLPLTARIAAALGNWLAPAFGAAGGNRDLRDAPSTLWLWYDADQVDALSADREALWARIVAADFLTVNEKRAAVGYGEVDGGSHVSTPGSPRSRG